MNVLLGDLRYLIRTIVKGPGFTITAIITLALGIGATTAVFSIVNTVLLKPLVVSDPDRLVMLLTTEVSEKGDIIRADSDASPLKFELWRGQTNVIQNVSAFLPGVVHYSASGAGSSGRRFGRLKRFFAAGEYQYSEAARLRHMRIFRAGPESWS